METKEIIQIALIALVVYTIMTCISKVREGFNRYASLSGANNLVLTDADGNLSSIQFPKGMIMLWKGSVNNVPEGWALCDGTKDTPDLRGRFVLGANPTDWPTTKDASLSVNQLEQKGGAEKHILTVEEMPSHNHTVDGTAAVGAHGQVWVNTNSPGIMINREGMDRTGGDQAHNNMPPYYVLAYIMKM